jgi:hypothetical protein
MYTARALYLPCKLTLKHVTRNAEACPDAGAQVRGGEDIASQKTRRRAHLSRSSHETRMRVLPHWAAEYFRPDPGRPTMSGTCKARF